MSIDAGRAIDAASQIRNRWQSYPDYRASGLDWLGEIPSHWDILRLKATVEGCINGVWGEEANDGPDDMACIRVADFDRVSLTVRDDNLTARSIPNNQQSGRLLEVGDLLLEKSGGGEQQLVGAVVYVFRCFWTDQERKLWRLSPHFTANGLRFESRVGVDFPGFAA